MSMNLIKTGGSNENLKVNFKKEYSRDKSPVVPKRDMPPANSKNTCGK